MSGYDLFRNSSSAGTTPSTTKTFSSLTCGTSYTLGVDAYDAAGNKSATSTVVASTAACPDTQAPNAPTGLFVTGSTATSISLSWSPAFDNVGVTGYDAYIGSTSAGPTTVLTLYTFAGLACGTTYTLSVDAFDAAGNHSGKSSLTTSTAPCPVTLASVRFNAPSASSTVSGSVIWSVQPAVAFDHVDFLIDGTVDWTEHSCPCYFNGDPNGRLDTTTLSNGSHTLKASAYDAGGTKVAESSETVTVNNTAAPAPPPTTTTTPPPPTTTTPPPTTTTPPPTTTTPSGGSCFASPGSCGYPDPAYGNVGVPAGTQLTNSGDITVTKDGTVLNGLNVSGSITVSANNVTIENSRVTMTGGGCGPTNTCGNADIRLTCACTVTISHVELTTDSSTTVEHAIRNSYGGTILVDHVYQHGGTDALCWCGDATITDSYSTIHLAIGNDHLENLYIDGYRDDVEHNVLINSAPQTANIFGNTNGGSGGACSNRLTVKSNLMAGGGYSIYPCGNASSVGSATLDFESNTLARCGGGTEIQGAGGTWLCPGGADQFGLFPRGGSFGHDMYSFCGASGWTWKNNVWDDGGTVAC